MKPILGKSEHIIALREQIAKLSTNTLPIFIEAETGSGKELVARNIHFSQNPKAPFVAVDCGTIPEALAESFLFGHERGAFTGALRSSPGVFEQALGGVLFLDELGSLSWTMQKRFLRVLETREVKRLGGQKTIPVNFRLISAINTPVSVLVEQGTFSMDLLFRLNAFSLSIPPLRERMEDLEIFLEDFLPGKSFHPELLELFYKYSWPGNIRELKNVLSSLLVLASPNALLEVKHLPQATYQRLLGRSSLFSHSFQSLPLSAEGFRLGKERGEREYLKVAYQKAKGNISYMSRSLCVDRSCLYQKLRRYDIHRLQ